MIMKKRILFLLIFFLSAVAFNMQAQDTIRSLIFTEWRGAGMHDAYFELTNVGNTQLDLSNFTVGNINAGSVTFEWDGDQLKIALDSRFKKRLSGTLDPGESLVFMNVLDALPANGIPYHRVKLIPHADIRVHVEDIWPGSHIYKPEWEMWGKDSVDVYDFLLRHNSGVHASVLFYHLPSGDSVMVDQVKLNLNSETMKADPVPTDVAGVFEASFSHTLVRKADPNILGNTDWDDARGIDITDSEWLPIPHFTGDEIFTTVGTHGDFGIDMTSGSVDFDTAAATMNLPWGIFKGDSLIHELDLGPGMAWLYIEDTTSVPDSAHTIVQTGDILNIYACGNDLEQISFNITVAEPTNDMASVFPLRTRIDPEEPGAGTYWGSARYYVTDEFEVDTIGDVPFATRVDTLYKYLEKAPDATWKIIWVDGIERVDLKYGDILEVTAEDGTTVKEYFIDVQEFEASDNAYLAAITWPGKEEFLEGWKGDTIPTFSPSKTAYVVNLPFGTTNVPPLAAIPQNVNANISMKRAISLRGDLEERTTVFTVTAEDDSTVMEYSVIFEVEKDWAKVQKYHGSPFFSEFVTSMGSWIGFVEVMNPGNVTLDLSEYLFVKSASINPAEGLDALVPAAPDADDFKNRYRGYVPGYKYYEDTASWLLNPGKLQIDPNVDPVVDPLDVFVMSSTNHGRGERYLTPEQWAMIDKGWHAPGGTGGIDPETGINLIETFSQIKRSAEALFIFKIKEEKLDSLWNGKKAVGDPNDYDLVEAFGDLNPDGSWEVAGRTISSSKSSNIRRKSYIYKGVTEIGEGLGTHPDTSDWIVLLYPEDIGWRDLPNHIDGHVMDVVTLYMSTITSTEYLVDDGFEGDLDIQGDFSATTVSDFYGKIKKADTAQTLTVISGADGSAKDLLDNVAGDDTLVVVSADGLRATKYALVDQPLDDNAILTVKSAYTGSYEVIIDGAEGTITGSGVRWGVPIKEILAALIVPELATFNVIDQNNNLIPGQVLNFDTVMIDVRLSDSIFFEVIAQNGTDIITYQLKPESQSSDAFVISSVFLVDQDNVNISLIPQGIGVAEFYDNISPVTGATATLLDKYGLEREYGILSLDDKLMVVSQDATNTVYYYLNFFDEDIPDNNIAPTLSVDITSANVVLGETLTLTATADDDGMPLPTMLTITWEVISGEGVTIASPDALVTDITFAQTGAVVLQVTVDDGEISMTEIVNVGVSTPDNSAPTVSVATASFTIEEGESINVSATADDDGNPVGSTLSYAWSVKTGEAANVTIASADQLDSEVTFSTAGVYTLQITVTDGELVASDIVVVVVEKAVGIVPVLEPAMQLYPNPVSGILTLELQNMGKVNSVVKIYSITGQAVYNGEFTESKLQIDVSNFDAGLYFITVRAREHVFNHKIQIVK